MFLEPVYPWVLLTLCPLVFLEPWGRVGVLTSNAPICGMSNIHPCGLTTLKNYSY